jgi:hypothetical protein
MSKKVNFHEHLGRPDDVSRPSITSFGFTFTFIFAVIGGLALSKGHHWGWAWVGGSLTVLAVTYLRPSLLAPLNELWFRLSLVLHKVLNPIIMMLLFVVGIIPLGLIMKIVGRDTMGRRFDGNASSYWVKRDASIDPVQTMRRQF